MDQETQAFPKPTPGTPGMTLRDYFAAKAMHAFLSSPDNLAHAIASQGTAKDGVEVLTAMSYVLADEMIKARGAK